MSDHSIMVICVIEIILYSFSVYSRHLFLISSASVRSIRFYPLLCPSFHEMFPWYCCRKGDPFQGLKVGSCLTLGNELFKETHVLTKQEILLGKGARAENSRLREPRGTALPRGS